MTDTTHRVRELIAKLGTSQADFASAVGLDPSKLSKSLGGARRFSSLDLARIAEHANVTVDWLLTGDESPVALAARAHAGSRTSSATAEARRTTEVRASATRLGYAQEWRLPEVTLPQGRAHEQGEALAGQVLNHIRRQQGVIRLSDLPAVIEEVFGVDVCVTDLGDGFDGMAVATQEARMILASATPNAYRQRFTIAHELAHLLVADSQELHLDEDVYGAATKREPSEIRANAFAAAFLMPRDELRDAVKPEFTRVDFLHLSARLQVTPGALGFRLLNLRMIDEMLARQWGQGTAMSAAKECNEVAALSSAVQRSSAPRPPGILARDLMQAYLDGATTVRLYAELLGVEAGQMRARLERADSEGG